MYSRPYTARADAGLPQKLGAARTLYQRLYGALVNYMELSSKRDSLSEAVSLGMEVSEAESCGSLGGVFSTTEGSRGPGPDALAVVDEAAESGLDALTALAGALFDTRFSAVIRITANELHFQSKFGFSALTGPRCGTVWEAAIRNLDGIVVMDADTDPGYAAQSLFIDGTTIGFFAGRSVSINGRPIGAFCVFDEQTRSFRRNERDLVLRLSVFASAYLDVIGAIDDKRRILCREAKARGQQGGNETT